ncbi:heat shock factor-type transcription factor [Mucor lusitanicus]|uniref:Heat shock factor-type transcription factor n=1 Tax=Mucor circinelloides f. lusitanicus TaxID=29924 RepID=A0A8H4B9V5_MUCCL|nr:heat shock factor-type transcription factor [Mucor lusitanicus]
MDYQHYNDPSLIPFHAYQHVPSAMSTSPTADLSACWNTHPLDGNEDMSQPERGIAGFVSKLYQCLQAPDDGHKYARWCRHNGIDMFIIDCIPKFTEIVLPQLFKHCKFASFVRQLNIYGFQRDTDARKSKDSKDKETCRWHHIHFRPGRRDLFHLIRRKTPRYSRRKRPRTEAEEEEEEEEDPETILNLGSGDESDTHHEDNDSAVHHGSSSLDGRRCSASSASSSSYNTLMQPYNQQAPQYHHPSATTTPTDILFDTNPQQQHMYPPLFTNALTSPISTLEETHTAYGHPVQSTAPTAATTFASTLSHLPQMTEQAMAQDEEQLKAQVVQLRKSYLRMYKILTGEVGKAFNLVEVQRSRIEFLEGSLRQLQQQQLQQQQMRIDTSSYQYNPILHTAPTTPIYHPSLSATSTQQHPNFLFPTHEDVESTHSPTTLPEKWLSPFHQSTGLSSSMTTD